MQSHIEARDHPEYYVIYTFEVVNVDDNCNAIGNDTFTKTYAADLAYDESGTLSVSVSFNQSQQQAGTQTLVCIFGSYVQINGTTEAVNFSCTAQDRCVVAVDFADPGDVPLFPLYREEANNNFPCMWSWIPGWNESSRFADEESMLMNITYFYENNGTVFPPPEGNEDWYLGNLSFELGFNGRIDSSTKNFVVGNDTVNWSIDPATNVSEGLAYCDYYINPHGAEKPRHVRFRLRLWASEPSNKPKIGDGQEIWRPGDKQAGEIEAYVKARNSSDIPPKDGNISVNGWYWATNLVTIGVQLSNYANYKIHVDPNANQSVTGGGSYYWKFSCAYQNETSNDISVSYTNQSGITTVKPDISNVLSVTNGIIYSFAGDCGNTRIEFVV